MITFLSLLLHHPTILKSLTNLKKSGKSKLKNSICARLSWGRNFAFKTTAKNQLTSLRKWSSWYLDWFLSILTSLHRSTNSHTRSIQPWRFSNLSYYLTRWLNMSKQIATTRSLQSTGLPKGHYVRSNLKRRNYNKLLQNKMRSSSLKKNSKKREKIFSKRCPTLN